MREITSPLAQPNESDEKRLNRILKTGNIKECLLESTYWLEYYLSSQQGDQEPLSTAIELNSRCLTLLGVLDQPEP